MRLASGKIDKCTVCGGPLGPLCICSHCNVTHPKENYFSGRTWNCPGCKESMPIQFSCGNCGTRYLYEEVVKVEEQAPPPSKNEAPPPKADAPKPLEQPSKPVRGRPPRRLKGDFDERDIREIARIPGVGNKRAEALCRAGYNSLQKVKRATLEELSAIPDIGPDAAKSIKSSTNLVLILPRRRSKEDIFEDERECAKCGLPVPVFMERCLDCDSEFESEDFDDAMKSELKHQGIDAVIEFYGHVLCKTVDDARLWHGLSRSLSIAGRIEASKKAIKKALKLEPKNEKFLVLKERLEHPEKLTPAKRAEPVHVKAEVKIEKEPERPPSVPAVSPERLQLETAPALAKVPGTLPERPPERQLKQPPIPEEPKPLHELREAAEVQAPEFEGKSTAAEPRIDTKPSASKTEEQGPATPKKAAPKKVVEVIPQRLQIATLKSPGEARVSASPGRRPLLTGYGLVNGRGRVNGLINGNGFVNGSSISDVRLPRGNMFHRYVAVAVLLMSVFLIINSAFQLPVRPAKSIQIDGSFGDWQPVGAYRDATPSNNPNANLVSYALKLDGRSLFFSAEVEGTLFADTQGYDAFYIFLDTDGDNSTGYWCGPLGADYMIYVDGFNSTVSSSSLQTFAGQDRFDWNRWFAVGSMKVAVSGSRIEGEVPGDLMMTSNVDSVLATFVVDDQEGGLSQSAVAVGLNYGILKVTQQGLRQVLPTGSVNFLELTFDVIGQDITLEAGDIIISHTTGTQISGIPSSMIINEGSQRTITVSMDASIIATGEVVQAWLASVTADRPVTIIGSPARAYVISQPSDRRIDGLFADWPSPHIDTNVLSPGEGGVDIEAHDGNSTGATAFIYFRTAKGSFEGGITPLLKVRVFSQPGTGGGSPGSKPKITGESTARIYVQSAQAVQNGLPVGGILADYMIEARGKFGSLRAMSAYQWQGRWVLLADTPRAAMLANEVEISATISGLDLTNASYLIETRNWRGHGDQTVVMGTRGVSGSRTRGLQIVIMGSSTLLTALPTSNPPTIDGDWNSTEWAGADSYTDDNIEVYVMQNGSDAYFAIRVKADTNYNAGDYAEIAFDTDDGNETTPQAEDRKFSAADPNGNAVTEDYSGDGAGWDQTYESPYTWAADGMKDTGDGNYITYEFAIPFEEVWGTPTPSGDQTAGLAIHVHDDEGAGADYFWGSTDLNNPSSYGTLDIPEFEEMAVLVLFVPAIVILLMRRPGKVNKHRKH